MNSFADNSAAILACHEMRCAWSHESPWYVTTNRTGKRVWERLQPCLRGCGSSKRMRVTPSGTFEPIGQPKYIRPDEWYEIKQYFSAARRQRILDQQRSVGMEYVLPESQKEIKAS